VPSVKTPHRQAAGCHQGRGISQKRCCINLARHRHFSEGIGEQGARADFLLYQPSQSDNRGASTGEYDAVNAVDLPGSKEEEEKDEEEELKRHDRQENIR